MKEILEVKHEVRSVGYTLLVKKNRWKVTNTLVVTNIFPRSVILPD